MNRLNRWLSPVALAALVMLSACTAGFRQPEVELQGIQLGGLGLTGGTVNVNVRITNPNGIGFRSDRLDYQLQLRNATAQGDSAWIPFAQGSYTERFTIGANDTQVVSIPVSFTYSQLGGAGRELLRQGSFQYRATGRVDVHTSFGGREVPFRKTGTFSLSGSGL